MSHLLLTHGTAQRLPLADQSVNTIVTSPPYFGLRSYGGLLPEPWLGGELVMMPGVPPLTIPGPQTWEALDACAHVWQERTTRTAHTSNGTGTSTLNSAHAPWAVTQVQTDKQPSTEATCTRCGCWYGTLGNEPTVELYTWHTVLWLRECYRVLRDDGVLWLNLGDSYGGSWGNYGGENRGHGSQRVITGGSLPSPAWKGRERERPAASHFPQGSLLLIPHRIALAAQAEGWVVRNDTVWAKVAPMPESVAGWAWQQKPCACLYPSRVVSGKQGYASQGHRESASGTNGLSSAPSTVANPDCPTCQGTGHTGEPVLRKGSWRHTRAHEFLFMLTKQMGYWSNGAAVQEESSAQETGRNKQKRAGTYRWKYTEANADPKGGDFRGEGGRARPEPAIGGRRNPRSVLTPAPSPLHLAHFATFPAGLIEPLIRATCPERVCTACGEPWAPGVTSTPTVDPSANGSRFDLGNTAHHGHVQAGERFLKAIHGLAPTCPCPLDTPGRPGVCLDPFAGSGTTMLVARGLGRRSVGVEASAAYLQLARDRLGLVAIADWEGASRPRGAVEVSDLPLFRP